MSVILTRLLGILRDRTPTLSEPGARLQLDKASISGLVSRAERRGLVERVRSTEDARAVHIHLTEEGRRTITAGERGYVAAIDDLLADLTPAEAAELTRLAGLLVEE